MAKPKPNASVDAKPEPIVIDLTETEDMLIATALELQSEREKRAEAEALKVLRHVAEQHVPGAASVALRGRQLLAWPPTSPGEGQRVLPDGVGVKVTGG